MKPYQNYLLSLFVLLSAPHVYAGYDEYNCSLTPMMKASPLACVACGISEYYYKKSGNRELVTPSHRWLTLLGIKARNTLAQEEKQKKGTFTAPDRAQLLQEEVIKDLKTYGFCKNFPDPNAKVKKGEKEPGHDISREEWKEIDELVDKPSTPSEGKYNSVLKKFGFSHSTFFGNSAFESFNLLFEGANEARSVSEKRTLFKDKLKDNLKPEYSTDKTSVSIIENGDNGDGLRSCLNEVKSDFLDKSTSDEVTYEMCKYVANACDLKIGVIGHPRNICSEGLDLPNDYLKNKNLPAPPSPGAVSPPASEGAR